MATLSKLMSAAAAGFIILAGSGGALANETASEQVAIENTGALNTGALSEMFLGDMDAPVTVIEYASLTCSHCAHWHEEIFPTVYENYIKTGKVRFILREMPVIPGHPALVARSYAGSMLARCAADASGAEGYFAMMDTLFETQEVWAFGDDARAELLKTAANAGIDEPTFDACLQRADLKAHIDGNVAIATDEFELQGTPGFIINGKYERFQAFEDIYKALDAAAE